MKIPLFMVCLKLIYACLLLNYKFTLFVLKIYVYLSFRYGCMVLLSF